MSKRISFSKISIVVIITFFFSFAFLVFWQYRWPTEEVILRGEILTVQIAHTPNHWYKGLGGRTDIKGYDGLLFVYPSSDKYGVVMRDMLFPIDVVWLQRGEIVDMVADMPIEPGKKDGELTAYYPRLPVNMVLELPAGDIAKRGLKIGDKLGVPPKNQ